MPKLPITATGIGACIPYDKEIYEVSGLEFCDWEDKLALAEKYPDESSAADWITFRFLRSLGFEVKPPKSTENPPLNYQEFKAKQETPVKQPVSSRPHKRKKKKPSISNGFGTIELEFYDLQGNKKLGEYKKENPSLLKQALVETAIWASAASLGIILLIAGYFAIFFIALAIAVSNNSKAITNKKNKTSGSIIERPIKRDLEIPKQVPTPKLANEQKEVPGSAPAPKKVPIKERLKNLPMKKKVSEAERLIKQAYDNGVREGDRLRKKLNS